MKKSEHVEGPEALANFEQFGQAILQAPKPKIKGKKQPETGGWALSPAGCPHIRVLCECVGAVWARQPSGYDTLWTNDQRTVSGPACDLHAFRLQQNPHIAKCAMCGAPGLKLRQSDLYRRARRALSQWISSTDDL